MMQSNTHAKIGTRAILVTILMVLALSFQGYSPALAQAGDPPVLFQDAAQVTGDIQEPAHVMRSRYVNVDVRALFDARGNPRDKNTLPAVVLNLFPDANFIGIVTKVERNEFATSWVGRLKGVQQGYFYLVVADGAFMAHVGSTRGIYEVAWGGENVYKAIQIDQSKFIDHNPAATFDPPGNVLDAGSLGAAADTGSTIDIMVAYTDDARVAAGGTANIKAAIALAVTETNTSYANAGITPRLRLVHVEEYSYAETGDLFTDLNRLKGSGDGYFDSIHTLRNTYGADMVGLIVENGGPYCGLAAAVMASATNAFQVTDRGCATGYYSFGHEFGHLQGARHDLYVDGSTSPYAYGHGYVHTGSVATQRWRTVMAYNNKCSDLGYNCTRLQWWSNPTKIYNTAAMGVTGSSENYKVLNNTAYTVANFRSTVISPINFNSGFNGSSSGWSAVYGTWNIASSAYYRTNGMANLVSSAKYNATYGDLTFEARMKRIGTCVTCANKLIIRGKPGSLNTTKSWFSSYEFAYNNNGYFLVGKIGSTGNLTTLKAWTASSAIQKNDWNTLKVVAVGSSLKFYINGTLVWSGTDTALKTGQVGIGMFRDANAGTLDVDWAKLTTTPTADQPTDAAVETEADAGIPSEYNNKQ